MFKKHLNLMILIVGLFLAMLSSYLGEGKKVVLTAGFLIMFLALYRISKKLPSRNQEEKKYQDEEE